MQLTMDGGATQADLGLKTWGELLASVELGLGPDGRVVTEVRFDGVVQPSFRDAETLNRRLDEPRSIEIETSTVTQLLESTKATAVAHISALVALARQAGHAFRRHDVQDGNDSLKALLDGLRTMTSLTSALHGATAAVTGRPHITPSSSPLDALERALESLVDLEAAQDWIAIADLLEYDIAAALPRWQEVL
jgi:hypothetical protein